MRQPKETNKRKHRILRKTKLVSTGSIWPLWSPFLKSIVTIALSLASCVVIILLCDPRFNAFLIVT